MMNADSRMWKEEGGSRMQNVSAPQDSGGPHLRRCAKKQWRRGCDGRHAIGADEAGHRMTAQLHGAMALRASCTNQEKK